MRVVPLQPRFRIPVDVRAEIAVLFLGPEDGLDPDLGLVFQGLVIKYICQRQESVNPIRSSLPGVPVSTQPGVTFADDVGINLIQMAGQTGHLDLQLHLEPPLGLDSSEGKLQIPALQQRRAVGDIILCGRGECGQHQNSQYEDNSFHVLVGL